MCRKTKPVCTQLLMSLFFWSFSRQTFSFKPVNSVTKKFSMSRQDFFKSLAISVTTRNSLVATDFSFLILVACLVVCHDIELYVVSQLPWPFSVLLKFLMRPTFSFIMSQQEFLCLHSSCVTLQQLLVATRNSPPSCFVCRDINNLCRDRDFVHLGYEF